MRKPLFCLFVVLTTSINLIAQNNANNPVLRNSNDSLSYFIGLDLGLNLSENNLGTVNLQLMMKGIQDQFDKSPAVDITAARQYIQNMLQAMAEANALVEKQAGLKFLDENKKKPGIQTTASGLWNKVITQGTGIKPTATDIVEVHYHGTLVDGTVFDSSVERGEKISFALNQVIEGWTEGLQLMSVGSKYIFYVPENLAYGSQAMGVIKPYSTLIFEVELFNVTKN